MRPEHFNEQPVERMEELNPLERFDQLLGHLVDLARGQVGWQSLPQIKVTTSHKEEEETYAQFFYFAPKPTSGYETGIYSPSIMLALGQNLRDSYSGARLVLDPDTEKPLDPYKQYSVRRVYLDGANPIFDKKRNRAIEELALIEKHFFRYREASEALKKSSLNH